MIRPIGSRIIVKLDETEDKTTSGIIIKTEERPLTGTVIAVGTGTQNLMGNLIPLHCQVGDKVLLNKFSGIPVKLDGEEFIAVKEEELIGIL